MTRINLIPVEELTDQHLMAEYRELPMVARALERTLASKVGFRLDKISDKYVLGTGHVYFFFNKAFYLVKRYNHLINELRFRGFDINPENRNMYWEIFGSGSMCDLQMDWEPSEEEIEINRARISEKIAMKPDWYKNTRKNYEN